MAKPGMSFNEWCTRLDLALEKNGQVFTSDDLDILALKIAFQGGESPSVFAQRAKTFIVPVCRFPTSKRADSRMAMIKGAGLSLGVVLVVIIAIQAAKQSPPNFIPRSKPPAIPSITSAEKLVTKEPEPEARPPKVSYDYNGPYIRDLNNPIIRSAGGLRIQMGAVRRKSVIDGTRTRFDITPALRLKGNRLSDAADLMGFPNAFTILEDERMMARWQDYDGDEVVITCDSDGVIID